MFGRLRQRRWGLFAGGAVTLVGCGLLLAGVYSRLEDLGRDLHIRHFSSIPADPRIVMVDIDDQSVRAAPWPWPRRTLAELVRTLDELGAKSIVLDIVLDEPADPRHDHPALRNLDIDPELTRSGDLSDDPIVYDDRELEAAIAAAENVYLAMFFDMSSPAAPNLGRFPPSVATEDRHEFERLVETIEKDFGLDVASAASQMGVSAEAGIRRIEKLLPSTKRWVARRKAKHFLTEHPNGSFREFFVSVLPGESFDALTADRADLANAFRWADAQRVVLAKNSWRPANKIALPWAHNGTFPLAPFARAADGVGMVSFLPSTGSGVVRALPLAALNDEQNAVLQLGLLPTLDIDGRRGSEVRVYADPGGLIISTGDRSVPFPLDGNGKSLIHWHVAESGHWEDSFSHVPAARILEIVDLQDSIRENESRLGLLYGELIALRHAETPTEYTRYEKAVLARRTLLGRTRLADRNDDPSGIANDIARLSDEIAAMHAEALTWLTRLHGLWQDTKPETDAERQAVDQIQSLFQKLVENDAPSSLQSINAALALRIKSKFAALRPMFENRICFVGYTASAVADVVSVPPYAAMPGVMAHANVCNMVLQNRPLRPVGLAADIALMLAAGFLMTLAAVLRGPVSSALSLTALCGGVLLLSAYAFHHSDCVIASVPTAANTAGVWAVVTAYRQLTEERARRNFERALKQYTSPAVAARIAESLDAMALAPQPAVVTCFYADLAGFTRLSAQLGPERTRLVLNPYLAMLTRELTRQGALVNKFTGDGVFAFFNAPILPCPAHAAAACRAALSARAAMVDLNRQLASVRGEAPLCMRVGLSTGQVFVGDFGSDTKLDYTCIGDAVNLGSRIETAGKHLGGGILVDEATANLVGGEFRLRPLGRFELPGFADPILVSELLSESDHADNSEREFLDHFAHVVSAFETGKWAECRVAIQECTIRRPNDLATQVYSRELNRRKRDADGDVSSAIRLGSA